MSTEKEIIPCICTICGVRNNFKHPDGLCQNGHDSWLEYRDIRLKKYPFKLAMQAFKMSASKLTETFMDTNIKQLTIIKPIQL